jgi:hypothetical protein
MLYGTGKLTNKSVRIPQGAVTYYKLKPDWYMV